jgi:uncharacterized protein (TIGR02147 family)
MNSIFDYNNYREFLRDFYGEQKTKKTGFTYAQFSSNAGIQSPNYYKLVMDGQKNLTAKTLVRFSIALNFEDSEKDFFEALVQFNQASSGTEKEYFSDRITRLRTQKKGAVSKRVIEEYEFESISSWTHHAVLLLTNLKSFRESPRWISKKLFGLVSESEVVAILARLEILGLLKRDKDGRLLQSHKRIRTRPELKRQSAQIFYEGILARAAKAFHLEDADAREFNAYMVGLSPKQVPELKKKVREFMSELNEWALENSEPEQIYSFVFSGFPLSSLSEDKRWWS